MSKQILVNSSPYETRVATLEDGEIRQLHIEREEDRNVVGNIYKGLVKRVLPGMQAAFLELGLERTAFLYVDDIIDEPFGTDVDWDEDEEDDEDEGGESGEENSGDYDDDYEEDESESEEDYPPEDGQPTRAESRIRDDEEEQDEEDGPEPDREEPRSLSEEPAPSPLPEELAAEPETSPVSEESPRDSQAPAPGRESAYARRSDGADGDFFLGEPIPEEERRRIDAEVPLDEAGAEGARRDAGRGSGRRRVPRVKGRRLRGREERQSRPRDDRSRGDRDNRESGRDRDSRESGRDRESRGEREPRDREPREDRENREARSERDPRSESEARPAREPREREGRSDRDRDRDRDREPREDRDRREARDDRDRRETRDERERRDARDSRSGSAKGRRGRRSPRGGGGRGRRRTSRRERRNVDIQDLLKEGQEILVQVAKAPIGTKGARLTTHISLPGRNLVLMPTVKHLGISRRIESDRERRRLRDIFNKRIRPDRDVGFIIRTVAAGKSFRELKADADYLLNTWDKIQEETRKKKAPALIHEDLSLALKTVRDHFTEEVDSFIIDNPKDYERVVDFISQFSPRLKGRVKLFRGPSQLFEHYGIEAEISRALGKKVWLKSGGYLLIDQSEALTAIDVNTGRYVGSKSLEETILKTNLEAVKEIAYQLRIRNIGGIIIMDLIDMESAKNRKIVFEALQQALSEDKARTNILKISELGLVEMTRKRTHEDLVRYLTEGCHYCEGRGYHKSRRTVTFEIFREIEKEAVANALGTIVVFANPEVVKTVQKDERIHVKGLEKRFDKKILVKPDTTFHVEQYEVFSKP